MADDDIAAIAVESRWNRMWTTFKSACEAMETTYADHQDRRIDLIEKRIDDLRAEFDRNNVRFLNSQ